MSESAPASHPTVVADLREPRVPLAGFASKNDVLKMERAYQIGLVGDPGGR
jgi:hypothetical protein